LNVGIFDVDRVVAEAFIESLNEHIAYVREAGKKIGVSEKQLEIHDDSKWTEAEFPGYARHFKGGGAPDEFATAWLHHIHYNPHHWQHWIYPDGFTPKGSNVENGVVEMPANYALEMIADWMGASRAYTGSWDMKDWLWNHIPKITVHSKTAKFLRQELDHLGYADVVYMRRFANEDFAQQPAA
jgi:hypothetical protein